jgi:hypothetical protein
MDISSIQDAVVRSTSRRHTSILRIPADLAAEQQGYQVNQAVTIMVRGKIAPSRSI